MLFFIFGAKNCVYQFIMILNIIRNGERDLINIQVLAKNYLTDLEGSTLSGVTMNQTIFKLQLILNGALNNMLI